MPDSHSIFLGLDPFPGFPCYVDGFFYPLEFGFHKATEEELKKHNRGTKTSANSGKPTAKAKSAPKQQEKHQPDSAPKQDEQKDANKVRTRVQKTHLKSKLQSIKAKATQKSNKDSPDALVESPAATPPPKRLRGKSSVAPEESEVEKLRKVVVGDFGWPFS